MTTILPLSCTWHLANDPVHFTHTNQPTRWPPSPHTSPHASHPFIIYLANSPDTITSWSASPSLQCISCRSLHSEQIQGQDIALKVISIGAWKTSGNWSGWPTRVSQLYISVGRGSHYRISCSKAAEASYIWTGLLDFTPRAMRAFPTGIEP